MDKNYAQNAPFNAIKNSDSAQFVRKDTLIKADSVQLEQKKGDIETTIKYSATDSIRMDVVKKIIYLYGNAKIEYGDISVKAERIEIDQDNNVLSARGVLDDSTGKVKGAPVFKQGSETYTSKEMRYNFKTKKGIISEVVTQQGEGYVHGEIVKRTENAIYNSTAKYTTCNLPHPHFYISARKIKVIPDDKLVAGPFNLVISDVPTPLGFFLGVFPLPKKQKSGLIFPAYGENALGFNLTNGGYYFALSDYAGLRLTGDIYSKGTWGTHVNSNYMKRYSFGGAVNFDYFNIKNELDDLATKSFRLQWQHSTLRRGNSSLSASVNFNSNKSFKRVTYSAFSNLSSNFQSSVNYRKAFGNTPFSMNVAARHNQNVQTRVNNLTFPEMAVTMNRIYPFKGRNSLGRAWYEKINVSYTMTTKFEVSTGFRTDTGGTLARPGINISADSGYAFSYGGLSQQENIRRIIRGGRFVNPLYRNGFVTLRGAQYGMRHSIPITTSIKILKRFSLNPGVNYEEFWYPTQLQYSDFNPTDNNYTTRKSAPGFYRAYSFSTGGTSLTTNMYGSFNFKNSKLMTIRHRLSPSVSYLWRPDLAKIQPRAFDSVTVNAIGDRRIFSRYADALYGGPTNGRTNAIIFNINNTFEAKVRNPKDTATPIKKFSLLDNMNFSSGYDFLADSFKVSIIRFEVRTRLFQKIDILYSSFYDPYSYLPTTRPVGGDINATYFRRVDRLDLLHPRLQGASINVGTVFSPKPAKSRANTKTSLPNPILNNPELYVDFNIPWSLNVMYVADYFRDLTIRYPKQYLREQAAANPNASFSGLNHSVTFNGDLSLSEKWKINFSSSYNFTLKQVPFYTFGINRDLHCWAMSINVNKFGSQPGVTYFFNIAAKASLLQDLKLMKRSTNVVNNIGY